MTQQQWMMLLRGLEPEELMMIQSLTKDMTEEQQQQFFALYQGKRKDQQTMLILTLIGFFGVAGIHRFVVGDTALGIFYLLTFGFCGVGTIIDVINVKTITTGYNQTQAMEAARMVRLLAQGGR